MSALPAPLAEGLAAALRGESVPWRSLGVDPDRLLAACEREDLTGLVHRRLTQPPDLDWPGRVRDELAREARAAAARELLRRREVASVLAALAAHDVHPVLIKGTPLAYTVYASPALRPRSDTDLMVRREAREPVRRVLAGIGYAATNYSDGEQLFCQFELSRVDPYGVAHAFDFHWRISTQSLFRDLLAYEELAAEATAVPALGVHARAAGLVHALLLACVHPVMHHRNAERLVWLHDIHLLAARLSRAELERFAALAADRGVATICAHQLELTRARLRTPLLDAVLARLAAPGRDAEPSASFLSAGRGWSDELLANLWGLARWRDRLRLVREVTFPAPGYMLRAYGVSGGMGRLLLPALYAHRAIRGVWRALSRRL